MNKKKSIPGLSVSEARLPARLKELALILRSLLNMLWTQLRPTAAASAGCWLSSDASCKRGEDKPYDEDWDFPVEEPQ